MSAQPTCASCGRVLEPAERGRPRIYCSRACQARVYRTRRAEAPVRAPEKDDGTRQLTVERIVRAGIVIADAEGLDALSMRRAATELGTGAMSLYRHVASKDDLVTLMVEAALAEIPLPDSPPRNWRHGLERAAQRDWDLYHRHPWILPRVMMTTRAYFSPALAADSESAFSSFDGLDLEPADAFRYMFMFASYVQGVALILVSDAEAERQSRTATGEGAKTPDGAQDPLYEPGAYPRLARAMRAGADPWDLDALFATGLSGVLDGIAADLARRHTGGA
ncbi:TetR/AcrR family transcriptional regulator [Kitasatospora sp. NPDC056651]|uniref:TetR/AcrR family transcriptional regulator n=1 Tax=Kitasatospora sp. NPDC056651 TaxID=3345892 RepID=UPI0036AC5709